MRARSGRLASGICGWLFPEELENCIVDAANEIDAEDLNSSQHGELFGIAATAARLYRAGMLDLEVPCPYVQGGWENGLPDIEVVTDYDVVVTVRDA